MVTSRNREAKASDELAGALGDHDIFKKRPIRVVGPRASIARLFLAILVLIWPPMVDWPIVANHIFSVKSIFALPGLPIFSFPLKV